MTSADRVRRRAPLAAGTKEYTYMVVYRPAAPSLEWELATGGGAGYGPGAASGTPTVGPDVFVRQLRMMGFAPADYLPASRSVVGGAGSNGGK
jgi:hypothetical protein